MPDEPAHRFTRAMQGDANRAGASAGARCDLSRRIAGGGQGENVVLRRRQPGHRIHHLGVGTSQIVLARVASDGYLVVRHPSLPRALEMAAPQLVELLPGHRLTNRLLDEGWGRSWGVFLRTTDASNLRHHLRKFLRVQDERGRNLLFRYYDPRVLRAYLPTCRTEDLRQLFGPVASYFAEAANGQALLEFELGSTGLRTRRIAMTAAHPGLKLQAAA